MVDCRKYIKENGSTKKKKDSAEEEKDSEEEKEKITLRSF